MWHRDPTAQELDALTSALVDIETTSNEIPRRAIIDLAYVESDFAHVLRAKIAHMDDIELGHACQSSGDPSLPAFVDIAGVPFQLTGWL